MSRLLPRNVFLRDQLCAAMRGAGRPLSTNELVDLMPRHTRRWQCSCDIPSLVKIHAEKRLRLIACHGDEDEWSCPMYGPDVYWQLRALDRLGLCRRLPVGRGTEVAWEWTWDASGIDELEAMLDSEALS